MLNHCVLVQMLVSGSEQQGSKYKDKGARRKDQKKP